jgi:hypothetical protein
LIDALLELEHISLDLFPGQRVPSIHRLFGNRVPSFLTPTRTPIFQVVVSPSAYPVAFPQAFASETIPLLIRIRLTPTPFLLEGRWGVPPFLIFVCRDV